jgi:heme/copper-type cytochrome/quinol oxidase subunit 3
MTRWIMRVFVLSSAVALTLGFYYYAAMPSSVSAAGPPPKAEPNVVYVDTTIRDKPAPDVE